MSNEGRPALPGVARRLLPPALGFALALSAALYARMLVGARAQLAEARRAAAEGDRQRENMHLRRALAYYAPANPWHSRAARQLEKRAMEAEASGRPEAALALWHTLRGAILGLRGLTRPLAAHLPQANRRIAALSARHPRGARALRAPAGQHKFLQRLEKPPEPDPRWTAAALAGFVLFVGAAFCTVFAGLDGQTQLRPARFWPLLLLTLLGLGLLLGGLAHAAA